MNGISLFYSSTSKRPWMNKILDSIYQVWPQ